MEDISKIEIGMIDDDYLKNSFTYKVFFNESDFLVIKVFSDNSMMYYQINQDVHEIVKQTIIDFTINHPDKVIKYF